MLMYQKSYKTLHKFRFFLRLPSVIMLDSGSIDKHRLGPKEFTTAEEIKAFVKQKAGKILQKEPIIITWIKQNND